MGYLDGDRNTYIEHGTVNLYNEDKKELDKVGIGFCFNFVEMRNNRKSAALHVDTTINTSQVFIETNKRLNWTRKSHIKYRDRKYVVGQVQVKPDGFKTSFSINKSQRQHNIYMIEINEDKQ